MNANRANGRGDFSTRITQVERNLHGELLASRLSPLASHLLLLTSVCRVLPCAERRKAVGLGRAGLAEILLFPFICIIFAYVTKIC